MTAGSGCSPDPPKTARELANTTTGLVPSARHDASSDSVPRRFVRRPRSKSASDSALTAAARWKITSAPASVSGPLRAGSSSSPRSPWIPATRPSAARSAGTGARSTSVTRPSGRASPPATPSDPAPSSVRARREPRKPEPPVTTTFTTAPPISVSPATRPEQEAGLSGAVVEGTPGQDAGQVLAVGPVGVHVLARLGALGGQQGGLGGAGAVGEGLLGGTRAERDRAHVRQRDPAVDGGRADDRPVVGPPDELLVAPGCTRAARHAGRGHQLARLQGGLEIPGEEVLCRDVPGAALTEQVHRSAEGDQRHRQVGRRIGVGQRAADRPAGPGLRIADPRGGMCPPRRPRPNHIGGRQEGVRPGRAAYEAG